MSTLPPPSLLFREVAREAPATRCPFHEGVATIDLLLAELDPREHELFDAVLDLRGLATARQDATSCIQQLFRVRSLLAGSHYLAFYRVRCWAHRAFRVQAYVCRQQPAAVCPFPLDAARFDEVVNTALASLAHLGELPAGAHTRVVFAPAR